MSAAASSKHIMAAGTSRTANECHSHISTRAVQCCTSLPQPFDLAVQETLLKLR